MSTVTRQALVAALDQLLSPQLFGDYCPNGLQVEGRADIRRVVTGVTACQALLDAAVEARADAVLVHHGYFWKSEDPCVTGMKRRRLATLLAHDINLLAYHLPLDAHPELGNNVQLARRLGLVVTGPLDPRGPYEKSRVVGNTGELAVPEAAGRFAARVGAVLGREVFHIGDAAAPVRTVGWCTGAAQGYIEQAVAAGVDLYLTGEVSEQTVHVARETGIQFLACGHHATERYGVQAVGDWLASRFGIEHRHVDIENPV
ncbi:MAG: Nif3-like dinuclear metal center hexameric protein [Pseudomonadota bacterium]